MSVLESNKIDAIGIERDSGCIILTISDHLNWDDVSQHLILLQEKINCYLSFIESEQLYETYPKSIGKSIVINIVCKYPISQNGLDFFTKVEEIFSKLDIRLRLSILDE